MARNGLESLEASERNQLASHIDLENERHRSYLRKAYEAHEHPDLRRFDYFYEAQCVWEDTMAENIAEHLKRHKERLAVFLGNGHIDTKKIYPLESLIYRQSYHVGYSRSEIFVFPIRLLKDFF